MHLKFIIFQHINTFLTQIVVFSYNSVKDEKTVQSVRIFYTLSFASVSGFPLVRSTLGFQLPIILGLFSLTFHYYKKRL